MMPEEGDAAELRRLQRKAYAPGGELSPQEARRLHELQEARRAAVLEPASAGPVETPEQPSRAEGEEAQDEPDAGAPVAPTRRAPVRIVLAFAAGAAALAAGAGIGLAIFGEDEGIPLTPEMSAIRGELEGRGEFDPGSVRAAGEGDGVTAWTATQREGELRCVMLTGPGGAGADFAAGSARCGVLEEEGTASEYNYYFGGDVSFYAVLPTDGDDVTAYLLSSFVGEPEVVFEREPGIEPEQYGGTSSISPSSDVFDGLVADGFAPYGTSALGEDGDVSLWYGWNEFRNCFAAYRSSAERAMVCEDERGVLADGGEVRLSDGAGGETVYRYSPGTLFTGGPSVVAERSVVD